jgi:AraC-like DNA-binding protein
VLDTTFAGPSGAPGSTRAQAVGLSRTSFAARFRRAIGEPPITHLTRLRLSGGAGYMSSTSRTIGDIARAVGYDNEASFSKAFKRAYGRSPGVSAPSGRPRQLVDQQPQTSKRRLTRSCRAAIIGISRGAGDGNRTRVISLED